MERVSSSNPWLLTFMRPARHINVITKEALHIVTFEVVKRDLCYPTSAEEIIMTECSIRGTAIPQHGNTWSITGIALPTTDSIYEVLLQKGTIFHSHQYRLLTATHRQVLQNLKKSHTTKFRNLFSNNFKIFF